jgi:hypothetical protein
MNISLYKKTLIITSITSIILMILFSLIKEEGIVGYYIKRGEYDYSNKYGFVVNLFQKNYIYTDNMYILAIVLIVSTALYILASGKKQKL